jgi:hypothetical protein
MKIDFRRLLFNGLPTAFARVLCRTYQSWELLGVIDILRTMDVAYYRESIGKLHVQIPTVDRRISQPFLPHPSRPAHLGFVIHQSALHVLWPQSEFRVWFAITELNNKYIDHVQNPYPYFLWVSAKQSLWF